MASVRTALISVFDKAGISDFARELSGRGISIISTGGTEKVLQENGLDVVPISAITKYPEMLDGRVKTLHPAIFGGILAMRNNEHLDQLEELGIAPIDMVVCNLYAFEAASKTGSLDDAIEMIDIGGVTLIRAAAKNYKDVVIAVSPHQYPAILEAMEAGLDDTFRQRLAVEAFKHTAGYDAMIHDYFREKFAAEGEASPYPDNLVLNAKKVSQLRYGENPYQNAAFYKWGDGGMADAEQLHGKKMSFNNILDANDALNLVADFQEPTVAEIKHTNPCGIASASTIYDAYMKSHETDPLSAFGGIVAANRQIDERMAAEISKVFVEVVIAPDYEPAALDILMKKKNIRILKTPMVKDSGLDVKRVRGGLLVQEIVAKELDHTDAKVITQREPTPEEWEGLEFAWKLVRHVKSNSIVFCKGKQAIGIGAGQMSRVDSVKIAGMKSLGKSPGSVMASDAFFPFRDGVDAAKEFGITAVIQPGGSIRDQEVVDAANEHGMAMVFTGYRVFKH
jgi:phosphoribosylaminoimidazolecarboxamide formyltransferase/IMP cyclohydrolase